MKKNVKNSITQTAFLKCLSRMDKHHALQCYMSWNWFVNKMIQQERAINSLSLILSNHLLLSLCDESVILENVTLINNFLFGAATREPPYIQQWTVKTTHVRILGSTWETISCGPTNIFATPTNGYAPFIHLHSSKACSDVSFLPLS